MGGNPRAGRTTVSRVRHAVIALDDVLARPVETAHDLRRRITAVARGTAVLDEYDLDGESFVRHALTGRIGGILLTQLLVTEQADPDGLDIAGWREALDLDPQFIDEVWTAGSDPVASHRVLTVVMRLRRAITAWIDHAPFHALIDLTPPSAAQLAGYELLPAASPAVSTAYIWLHQRCTLDELDRWSTDSLVAEFQWQEDRAVITLPDPVLEGPKPDLLLLGREVARRLTTTPSDNDDAERLFWQLQDQAREYLRHGRYTDAAALFDFFTRLHPDHERSLNNLGFCTLPSDPATALQHLRAAERKGYRPLAINLINQACALRALGRDEEALDRLEHYWQRELADERVQPEGFLWRRRGTAWQLYPEPNPVRALCRLGRELAEHLALPDRVRSWSDRDNQLAPGTATGRRHGPTAA